MVIVSSMHTAELVHPTQGDYKDTQLQREAKLTYTILIGSQ